MMVLWKKVRQAHKKFDDTITLRLVVRHQEVFSVPQVQNSSSISYYLSKFKVINPIKIEKLRIFLQKHASFLSKIL